MTRTLPTAILTLLLWGALSAPAAAEAPRGPSRLPAAQQKAGWWEQEVERALTERDPGLQNLKVTRLHYLLSEALRRVVGPEAGANFHAWAVWGSTKAGMTIRGKDFEQAIQNGAFRSRRTGRALAWLAGDRAGRAPAGALSRPLGLLMGRPLIRGFAARERARATRALLEANRLVIRMTARHTVRFLMAFHDLTRPDARRLDAFLQGFERGSLEAGGEDELRRAYALYYEARFATDLDRKREATFEAVIRTMRHEMTQMQPYFERALPRGLARRMLRYFSTYRVGDRLFDMRRDVRGLAPSRALRELDSPALDRFFAQGLAGGNADATGRGSRIARLGDRDDRLGYLFTLARGLHLDPSVVTAPMTAEQLAQVGVCVAPRELI